MDVQLDERDQKVFQEKLDTCLLSKKSYQALEVIFRQAMMAHNKTAYAYSNDWIEKSLQKEMSPEVRYRLLLNYVSKWEQKTGMKYGFERVRINELDGVENYKTQYQSVYRQAIGLKKQFSLFAESVDDFISSIEEKIEKAVSINERGPGRFISFVDGNLELQVDNHEYFVRYLGISHAIFYDYFERIAAQKEDHKKDGNDFYRFVAEKLRKDHGDLDIFKEIDGNTIRKKCHNNKLEKSSKWHIPQKLNLIDGDFLVYLREL